MSAPTTKIIVLKSFRFTSPADRANGAPLPVEHVFTVGEHDIDASIAAHPWMAAPNYADGCIERPEATVARLAAVKAKEAQAHAEAMNAIAQADAALARVRANEPKVAAANAVTEEDLNTPIGTLRARQQQRAAKAG